MASKFNGIDRFHYAWIIAIAGVLITGAGVGIFSGTLGVFIIPITEELGFMRGQFTAYTTISLVTMVILMPYFGDLFTRHGFRRISLCAAMAVGLVLLGFSFSTQLWHFYALAVVSGIFVNGMGMMAVGILVNRWFEDKKGMAIGIAYSGSGLMAAFMIPVSNMIIEAYGWRFGLRFLSGVTLVVLVLVIVFIVKDKPEDIGLEPYRVKKNENDAKEESAATSSVGLTKGEAIRKVSFWLLVIAVFGIGLAQAGAHVKTAPFLADIGHSSTFAATAASVYMILLTVNKVFIGGLMDRIGALKGGLFMGACCAIFPIFALFAEYVPMVWAYVFMLGIASSGATILGPVITARYFGRKDFAKIFSVVSMATMTGVAISMPGLGFVFDATGGYDLAWYLIIGVGVVVCVSLVGVHVIRGKEEHDSLTPYLASSDIIDFETSEEISNLSNEIMSASKDDVDFIKNAFEYVRDQISHSADIAGVEDRVVTCKASEVLEAKEGICYAKAHLLAALLRYQGVPVGFCYQRLILDDDSAAYLVVHGLNAVYIKSIDRWIRLDARGNKQGVDAQFSIGEEKLAFPVRVDMGEEDIPVIFAEPDLNVVKVLMERKSLDELWGNLPVRLAD